MKGIHLLVAISVMDQCDSHFMHSIAQLVQIHPEYDVLPKGGSECYASRDWLCLYAIQNNYDYICIVDSDEVFKPNDIETLLKDDKDIVRGVICKREAPFEPVIYSYSDNLNEKTWQTVYRIPTDLEPVDALGGGAMLLIKVSVLRQILNCTGNLFFPMELGGLHLSDDLSFFYRVRQCGIQPYIDGRVRLGHRGMQTVTPDYWEAIYEQKQEQGTEDPRII